ncbi:hypothetical protein BJX62DRAFT_73895 [Aspergillus germanicus]
MHIDESFQPSRETASRDIRVATSENRRLRHKLSISSFICWAGVFCRQYTTCMHSQGFHLIPRRYQVFLPCSRLPMYTRSFRLSTCASYVAPYTSYLCVSFLLGGYGEMVSILLPGVCGVSNGFSQYQISYNYHNNLVHPSLFNSARPLSEL